MDMASDMMWSAMDLITKRDASEADSDQGEASEKERFASWSIFILIMLLIVALFMSYMLQTRKVQAVHETVISIFAGMIVGLILRLTAKDAVLRLVTFDYQFFFNLLLPPIILCAGYELHQGNFFRNIGAILTFAFFGTFITAVTLGVILYVWALLPLEHTKLSFVDAIQVGATLSATDPVTILAIFTTYKVDPKLYTVIFGESILNDAVAIVLFETAQRYQPKDINIDERAMDKTNPGNMTVFSLFESFGIFLLVFVGSLLIGLAVGIGISLLLKFTYIRRFPKIESCIILLIAYASYLFPNAIEMSGIVSLLFCSICTKHYAYHNMSRRTQLTTKFIFQVLAQLSENFIFIYLGLSLFTQQGLEYEPLMIIVTVVGICVSRGLAVFPLSGAINWIVKYRGRRKGLEVSDELPWNHQVMLFWAGLRGAVGVALAEGLGSTDKTVLKATVLVVVVLTVIIFGGTTARMLEILGIRTGVVEEIDSDDEFDIEIVPNGTYAKRSGNAFGHLPKQSGDGIALTPASAAYSSGNSRRSPPDRPSSRTARRNSSRNVEEDNSAAQGLLSPADSFDEEGLELDLPPAARRAEVSRTTSAPPAPTGLHHASDSTDHSHATGGGFRQFLSGATADPAEWFRHVDEEFIKPNLLLDPGNSGHDHGHGNGNDNV